MPLPSHFEDMLEHGHELLLQQRLAEAAEFAHLILRCAPGNPRGLHLAGVSLAVTGEFAAAIAYLSQAIQREPSQADWYADLATVFYSAGQVAKAEQMGVRALALNAQCVVANKLLAKIKSGQGRDYAARKHLRALAAAVPGDHQIRRQLALAEYAVGDISEATRLMLDLISAGAADSILQSEFVSALLFDLHQTRKSVREYSEDWAASFCIRRPPRPVEERRICLNRKLRIGYLSGEFGATPSRHFLLPIFRHHDRERFEITCYHNMTREDDQTARFRTLADRWRNCADLSDDDLASFIERDEIDILIDLSGHHRYHRLGVFALRPAPIQAAFPNYPATTGIREIRYVFSDLWVCPAGSEDQYVETDVLYLSRGYLAYEPPADSPEVTESTSEASGGIVFALFQWPAKVNSAVWDAVAAVLRACPDSRLMVHCSMIELDEQGSLAREHIESQLGKRRICASRVSFRGWLPLSEHLRLLGETDIALDTFPYNGATTTCECLWMGVPVVTMIGEMHAARVGYELLDRVGLGELAAKHVSDYVASAVKLAQDRTRLRNLRLTLRDRMRQSTLLDPQPLVREIESCFGRMWTRFVEDNQ